ncbi:class I SAM-dependent methyltransferase [Actinocrispum wychmicini]|uniref:class I SAM-dependent methyltransferase n=1 Tax=Actinocrispum wychmicini TaxID=1213861 RepID=UPI0010529629|nr:class I SAM-dependent methyltransferase [Actinocrispum wychmicini]
MTHTPETFANALTAWQQWQESPWGRLRYTLAAANLDRHIAAQGDILDLAGADGGDSIPLARQGHRVTIADFTPDMLAAAQQRAQAAGVDITCVESDATDLPDDIGDYDVVLCHNLLQYQTDPVPTLKAAVNKLRPNGLLSVMAFNRHAAPLVAADSPTFNAKITLYTADEISAVLADLGCSVIGHYGIRSDREPYLHTARIFQLIARSQR